MELGHLILARAAEPLLALFFVAPAYVLVEVLLPRQRVSWRSRLQSSVFTLVEILFASLVFALFAQFGPKLDIRPLIRVDLNPWFSPAGWLGATAAAVLATIVGDFGFYWMHRAQHRFFWRFHSVHHSIEELSAVSCYHHVSEEVFRIVLIGVPFSFLWHVSGGPAPFILATVIKWHTFWVHSSSRLHWGPLRYILDDNRFHRIHHSRNPQHFNKNFGGFCTIWDQLFRTAYFPAKDEWPEVGLADRPEAKSIIGYIAAPFRPSSF